MKKEALEYFFVIAKFNNKYVIIGCYEAEQEAEESKKKFEKSMHLLNVSECIILKGKEITNREEIGFENDVKFTK